MPSSAWALLLHLARVVLLFSGMAVAAVAQGAARRRELPGEIAVLLGLTCSGVALVAARALVLVGSVLWLIEAWDGFYSLGDGWIAGGLGSSSPSCVGLRSARSQETRCERGHVSRGAGSIPWDARAVHLDFFTAGEEEDGAGLLLPEHLKKCGPPEAKEAVCGPGGHDSELTCLAYLGLAVHLDQHLAFEDAEDLVGVVVPMEVPNVVGRHGLNPHDESPQPMLGASDDANVAGPGRKRHLSRFESL